MSDKTAVPMPKSSFTRTSKEATTFKSVVWLLEDLQRDADLLKQAYPHLSSEDCCKALNVLENLVANTCLIKYI
ncbi:TPA: hypothetical protein ACH3X2_008517 [Trebouxia sp. C0005]